MPQLLGNNPDQVPASGSLGNMASQNAEGVIIRPQTGALPNMPGDMIWTRVSDTSVLIKLMGLDGTVRSSTLTFA